MKKPNKSDTVPLGRPRSYPGARLNIAARLQPPVYQQLHAAAQANGRSLSEEIEQRIVQSFEHDRAFPEPELRDLAVRLITRFADAGRRADLMRGGIPRAVKDWLTDPGSYEAAMLAVIEHLAVRNPGIGNIELYDYITWMRSIEHRTSPQQLRETLIRQDDNGTTPKKEKN